MLTLLIARHGNTFDKGDIPTRVGARTDLPLVQKGREQARHIANYLKENDILPDIIFTSDLRRTKEMAEIIVDELRVNEIEVHAHAMFNEIDYAFLLLVPLVALIADVCTGRYQIIIFCWYWYILALIGCGLVYTIDGM